MPGFLCSSRSQRHIYESLTRLSRHWTRAPGRGGRRAPSRRRPRLTTHAVGSGFRKARLGGEVLDVLTNTALASVLQAASLRLARWGPGNQQHAAHGDGTSDGSWPLGCHQTRRDQKKSASSNND